jgi:predicted ATP-dependent serine protease
VARTAARLKEASRLGLKRAIVSAGERDISNAHVSFGALEIERVDNLGEALKKGGL